MTWFKKCVLYNATTTAARFAVHCRCRYDVQCKDSGATLIICQWGFDDEANSLLMQVRRFPQPARIAFAVDYRTVNASGGSSCCSLGRRR